MSPKLWSNTAGGDWSTAGNWSPSIVPAAIDDVSVAALGNYTVLLPNGSSGTTYAVNSLTLNAAGATVMIDSVSTLVVGTTLQLNAGIIGGGTIQGGTMVLNGGGIADNTRFRDVKFWGALNTTHYLGLAGTPTFQGVAGAGRGTFSIGQKSSESVRVYNSMVLDNINITMGDTNSANYALFSANAATPITLTFGPASSVQINGTAAIEGNGLTLANKGAIQVADAATFTLGQDPTQFALANTGTITLGNASTFLLNWSTTTASLLAGLGTFTPNGGTLGLGGKIDNTGATIALGSGAFSKVLLNGTILGGTLITNGQALTLPGVLSGDQSLQGVSVRGELAVGSLASGGTLRIADSLTFFATNGISPGTLRLRGAGSTVYVAGKETWDNMSIIFDTPHDDSPSFGNRGVVGLLNNTASLTLGQNTTVLTNGAGLLAGTTVLGQVQVAGNGLLDAMNTTFAPTARIQVAFGGTLTVEENITSAALTTLAGQITNQGGTVTFSGKVDNTGGTLDLTTGGGLAPVTSISSSTINGGVVLNTGASINQPFDYLNGATLKGAFKIGSPMRNANTFAGGGVIVVRDSFKVQALAGSAGVLDLLSNNASIRADTTATLDQMTIRMGNLSSVSGFGVLTLSTGTTINVESGFASLGGVVDNMGTVNIAGSSATAAVSLQVGSTVPQLQFAGTFQNDGTVNVGSQSTLRAAGTLINTGSINLATGATMSVSNPAIIGGVIAFQGTGAKLTFESAGADGAILSHFSTGNTISLSGLAYSAASLSLSLQGQTLQIRQGGNAVASFTLAYAGANSYNIGEISIAAGTGGSTVLQTTHAFVTAIDNADGTSTRYVVNPSLTVVKSITHFAGPGGTGAVLSDIIDNTNQMSLIYAYNPTATVKQTATQFTGTDPNNGAPAGSKVSVVIDNTDGTSLVYAYNPSSTVTQTTTKFSATNPDGSSAGTKVSAVVDNTDGSSLVFAYNPTTTVKQVATRFSATDPTNGAPTGVRLSDVVDNTDGTALVYAYNLTSAIKLTASLYSGTDPNNGAPAGNLVSLTVDYTTNQSSVQSFNADGTSSTTYYSGPDGTGTVIPGLSGSAKALAAPISAVSLGVGTAPNQFLAAAPAVTILPPAPVPAIIGFDASSNRLDLSVLLASDRVTLAYQPAGGEAGAALPVGTSPAALLPGLGGTAADATMLMIRGS